MSNENAHEHSNCVHVQAGPENKTAQIATALAYAMRHPEACLVVEVQEPPPAPLEVPLPSPKFHSYQRKKRRGMLAMMTELGAERGA